MYIGFKEDLLARTLAVGRTREYGSKSYRASQHTAAITCEGCAFLKELDSCAFAYEVLGSCMGSRRNDNEDVIFEETNK